MIPTVKLQASVTSEVINCLSSIRANAYKLSYFHLFSLLLRFSYETKCELNHIDYQEGYSQNSENFNSENRKVAGSVTKMERSCGSFSGDFQSNCFFEMFREEHHHMNLSNKTPP